MAEVCHEAPPFVAWTTVAHTVAQYPSTSDVTTVVSLDVWVLGVGEHRNSLQTVVLGDSANGAVVGGETPYKEGEHYLVMGVDRGGVVLYAGGVMRWPEAWPAPTWMELDTWWRLACSVPRPHEARMSFKLVPGWAFSPD